MKSKILGILITLLFVAGYATLNYPVLGTLYNQIREGKVIDSYDHAVHTMNKEKLQKYLEDAQKYNEMLARENPQLSDAFHRKRRSRTVRIIMFWIWKKAESWGLWRFQKSRYIFPFIMEHRRKYWKRE